MRKIVPPLLDQKVPLKMADDVAAAGGGRAPGTTASCTLRWMTWRCLRKDHFLYDNFLRSLSVCPGRGTRRTYSPPAPETETALVHRRTGFWRERGGGFRF